MREGLARFAPWLGALGIYLVSLLLMMLGVLVVGRAQGNAYLVILMGEGCLFLLIQFFTARLADQTAMRLLPVYPLISALLFAVFLAFGGNTARLLAILIAQHLIPALVGNGLGWVAWGVTAHMTSSNHNK